LQAIRAPCCVPRARVADALRRSHPAHQESSPFAVTVYNNEANRKALARLPIPTFNRYYSKIQIFVTMAFRDI
jgi:hypothetical protein